jgi:hypothetical protein
MTTTPDSDSSYFFVPLGRERGGLLDLLGLAPGATDSEVGDALTVYRAKVKNDTRAKRRELKALVGEGQATAEQFKAQSDEWLAQENELLSQLNEIEAKRDQERAQQRSTERQGLRVMIRDSWEILTRGIAWTPDGLRALLAIPGPCPGTYADGLSAGSPARSDYPFDVQPRGLPANGPGAREDRPAHAFCRIVAREHGATWLTDLETALEARATTELGGIEGALQTGQIPKELAEEQRSEVEQRFAGQRSLLQRFRAQAEAAWVEAQRPGQAEDMQARRSLFDAIWVLAFACEEPPPPESILALLADLLPLADTIGSSTTPPAGDITTLEALCELVAARDVAVLRIADQLWALVGHTNRGRWRERVEAWHSELGRQSPLQNAGGAVQDPLDYERRFAALGPVVDAEHLKPRAPHGQLGEPEYPALSQPTVLSIDKLEKGDTEDLSGGPKRDAEQDPGAMLKALLGAMLASEGRAARKPESSPGVFRAGPGGGSGKPEELDLEDMFKALAAMKALLGEDLD